MKLARIMSVNCYFVFAGCSYAANLLVYLLKSNCTFKRRGSYRPTQHLLERGYAQRTYFMLLIICDSCI